MMEKGTVNSSGEGERGTPEFLCCGLAVSVFPWSRLCLLLRLWWELLQFLQLCPFSQSATFSSSVAFVAAQTLWMNPHLLEAVRISSWSMWSTEELQYPVPLICSLSPWFRIEQIQWSGIPCLPLLQGIVLWSQGGLFNPRHFLWVLDFVFSVFWGKKEVQTL